MSLRYQLTDIAAELDSMQIRVRFEETNFGVKIHADDYPSEVIAKRMLRQLGILIHP